jgi:hypothetical protein
MLPWCTAILVALLVVATPAGALPGDAGSLR